MVAHVFLVENHAVLRQALAAVLARGPDLDLCGAVESAEDAPVELASTACDVLVTDVGLPGMDGVAFTERLQAERPDLPVVVISADDEPPIAARAREAGARAFLPKNRLARTLPDELRGGLRGRSPFDADDALPDPHPPDA